MNILKKALFVIFISILGTGCATKVLQVSSPAPIEPAVIKGYVKISEVNDLRQFQKAPKDPSTPSIEGDLIDDKKLTDKSIGRMRHGLYHKALWNYTIKGDEDIYDVCRKIAVGSLSRAGYVTVADGHENYDNAVPVAVDILQFWAWMQPKFNIDLHFDGELHIRSLDAQKQIDVSAKGEHMFSTGFAGGSAWTKVVNEGVKDLDKNLVLKFNGATE